MPRQTDYVTIQNPILKSGADPFVAYDPQNKTYWYVQSDIGKTISVIPSTVPWQFNPEEKQIIWEPDNKAEFGQHNWAPELWFFPAGKHGVIDDTWVLVFTSSHKAFNNPYISFSGQRIRVLTSTTGPLGPYEDQGQVDDGTNRWTIDLTYLRYGEELYGISSRWPVGDMVGRTQHLSINPMSNPWTFSDTGADLTHPKPRTQNGFAINEGPQVFRLPNDQVAVIYSRQESWKRAYEEALLILKPDGNPLNPFDWEVQEFTIFPHDARPRGIGHGAILSGPEHGLAPNLHLHIFHEMTPNKRATWENRRVSIKEIQFNTENQPYFGNPSRYVKIPPNALE